MTKPEFINKVADFTGVSPKRLSKNLDAFVAVIIDELANGNDINIKGFGKFTIVKKSERKGRDPRTGEDIKIPAHKAVRFAPGQPLKSAIAG